LSHYHFTATEGAKKRLVKMGEHEGRVFVVGAPGLDGLENDAHFSRQALCDEVGFLVHNKIVLMVFHPVVQFADAAADEVKKIWEGLQNIDAQILWLLPNADAGGSAIKQEVEKFQAAGTHSLQVITHLPRTKFVSWMKHVDVMLGNSSSGIIEAATFDTAVVNIGIRQQGRERSANVKDVDVNAQQIQSAVLSLLDLRYQEIENVYGSGSSGEKMLKLLTTLPLTQNLLNKLNAY
jgi:GDP/UDP-N,N'-diacetylbacillosamine 2-epimerase (hydrolysing)